MDQMRSDLLDQEPPFVQGLAHQLDVEGLEVTQPAVDQLAGAARGAGREIALFDQGDRQTAAGGVEGDAAAGHAATDDEHIEDVVCQVSQRASAVLRAQRRLVGGRIDRGHGLGQAFRRA